jgi:hypothetical protein
MPPVAGPANARVVPHLVLDIDRRGWGLFSRLSGTYQRGLAGRETPPVIERNGWWHGPTISPQRFTGMASLATGGRPINERASEIGDKKSAGLDDPSLRVFRERAARRRR